MFSRVGSFMTGTVSGATYRRDAASGRHFTPVSLDSAVEQILTLRASVRQAEGENGTPFPSYSAFLAASTACLVLTSRPRSSVTPKK